MKVELLLWAVFMPLAWRALTLAPLFFGPPAGSEHLVLCLSFPVATWLAVRFERRLPSALALPLSWRPRRGLLWAAFLAGAGMSVLASEIGNIMLSLWPLELSAPSAPSGGPLPAAIIFESLIFPATVVITFAILVGRTALLLGGVRTGTIATALWGSLVLASDVYQAVPQQALLLGLATWLHLVTSSVWLPLAAYLPVGVMQMLVSLGLGPGIPGFDVVGSEATLQPLGFTLGGAAVLALSMGVILRTLERGGPRA